MIIAVGILVFMAICALSLVGLGESHSRVSRILNELDDNRVDEDSERLATPMMHPHSMHAQKIDCSADVFSEVGFTRSLLALSKVDSQVPYECPVLETFESSSLVSVRRVQSKNRGPRFENA